MPIGHNERRSAAEDAAADAEEQRIQLIKEQAAKQVPYALSEARRRVGEAHREVVAYKAANPNDSLMNHLLLEVQLAQQKVAEIVELRVSCRRQLRDMEKRR